MLGLLIWCAIGGSLGWLVSAVMQTGAQHAILINIIAGIVGAFVGGALVAPALQIEMAGIYMAAVAGAALLLGLVNLILRADAR